MYNNNSMFGFGQNQLKATIIPKATAPDDAIAKELDAPRECPPCLCNTDRASECMSTSVE